MKNTEVLFEKKESKLTITLDKDVDYKTIKERMIEILDSSEGIFDEIEEPVVIKGKRLLDSEEKEILELVRNKSAIAVEIERPKQMGLANINNIFNQDTEISNTKVFKGTIRSGRRIEYEGSIIVLGDVNGGAEVIAEENIIVLGNLRGFAHAGAKGNRSSFISANRIEPVQLRIADIILRNFDEKKEVGNQYDYASIQLGEIIIER